MLRIELSRRSVDGCQTHPSPGPDKVVKALPGGRMLLGLCALLIGAPHVPFMQARAYGGPSWPTGTSQADERGKLFPLDRGAYATYESAEALVIPDVVLESGRQISLQLARVSPFADDARVVLGTPEGNVEMGLPPVAVFGGHVAGDPSSVAYLSLSPYGVYGFVQTQSETFIISSGAALRGHETRICNLGSLPGGLIRWADFTCGTDGPAPLAGDEGVPARGAADRGEVRTAPCRVAKIAVETDTEFTAILFGGDTTAAAAYVTALLGAVSEIYTHDLNTRLTLSYIRVWDTDDPWTATDITGQLTQFMDYWNQHMQSVDRHAAHFLSARTFPDWTGLAVMGALCHTNTAYGLSSQATGYFPYPLHDHDEQNHDLIVVAHELGHNFGAPHTHELPPPVDRCGLGDCSNAWGGTIMSYCHRCPPGFVNDVLRFHERSVNECMLPFLASLTTCNLSAEVVFLQHPDDATVHQHDAVSFSASAFTPYGLLSYQWRKDGTALSDNERITGTTTSTLIVDPVLWSDAGAYDVVVTNDCGPSASAAASLSVIALPGDLNCDGAVNALDTDGFVLALFGESFGFDEYCARYPECNALAADMNGDGHVNGLDIDGFVAALLG